MDESNSTIGVIRAFNAAWVGTHSFANRLEEELHWMQNRLFDVGGPAGPGSRADVQEHANGHSTGRDLAGKTHG